MAGSGRWLADQSVGAAEGSMFCARAPQTSQVQEAEGVMFEITHRTRRQAGEYVSRVARDILDDRRAKVATCAAQSLSNLRSSTRMPM